MASFFGSVVAAASATVAVTVCSAVTFTGNTTHHNTPSAHRVSPDDIAHRGPFLGARHTGSLGQANSTIFFKPNAASAIGILAMHVVESPMVLTQRIQAAKAQAALGNVEPSATFQTQPSDWPHTQSKPANAPAASVSALAPALKPNKSGIFA